MTLPCRPVLPEISPSSAAVKTVTDATKRIVSTMMAIAVLAFLAATASAQSIGFTTDPVGTQYGTYADNGGATGGLNIGRPMTVTGAGIEVFQLGVFDFGTNGLAAAHTVTLFTNQTAIASVTVPAGTAAPLINAFRFAPLGAPLYLPAGNYSIVAYQMNGTTTQSSDPYGNGNAPGFNGSGNVIPGAGIYAFVTSPSPAYPNSGSGEQFAAVSFTFTNILAATDVWTGGGANNNWSTAGNWNGAPVFPTGLTFAGSTRLANNNDLTGITVDGITFDAAAGPFVLGGNDITLAGNISFNLSPAAPVTQTVNLNMALTTDVTIDSPANGNLILGGNITSGNNFAKTDAGALTLGGGNSFDGFSLNGGTTTITGNTTITGTSGHRIYVGDGDAIPGCNGTLVIPPGATFTVQGSFDDAMVIGRDGGSGTVIQNGGTFTLNTGNYLFVGASNNPRTRSEYDMNGGLLDMNGSTLGISLGAGVLVTGVVSQVSGVNTNVGNLQVGSVTGQGYGVYTLSGGSIYIGLGGITTVSALYALNLGGGTIVAQGSWSSSLNMNLTGLNGPVTFNPAGNTITLSGVLSGTGGLSVSGGGILELSGANTYSGDSTVNAGSILQLDATGSSLGAFRVVNGALLNLNFSGNYAVAHLYTNGVALPVGTYNAGNLSAFITGSGNLVVSSSISTGLWDGGGANNNWSTAGNWDQNAVPIFPIGLTFAGSTRLNNTNDLSSITVSSLTFSNTAGAFTIGGNDITLSGNIGFSGNPAAPITQTVNLNMAWNADKTIDTPANGNLSLGGDISDANNTLTKIDAGTLTLGGVDTFAGYIVNGGTNIITGNTTINGTGGSLFYLANGDALANSSGTLVIQPGATLDVTGTFGDAFVIGRDSGSGNVIQNGGTFIFNPNASPGYLFVGATSETGTRAEYDMNGGLLDMSGHTFGVALSDHGVLTTGVVNQVSGVITNVGNLWLSSVFAAGYSVYTLSGGSLYIGAGGITTSGGYAINLGGGTVGAEASWSSSLNMNLTGVNGSVTFAPAGNTITLSGVLSGNGGLTVAGSGTLELSGANTYMNDTVINAGCTLKLDAAGSTVGAFRVVNGALLNLNYSGNYIVAHFYTNGVALPVGTYNAGNLPGFITGNGNLQVAGIIFSTQPQNELVYLNGNYHQSATFTSTVVGGSATYQWFLNGNPVAGATSSSLTLSNLVITTAGNLYVVATGGSGSVTSSVVALTIYGVNNNVFAYDGFAYPAGSVDGTSQNGGFGWNGPWQQTDGNGVIITLGNLIGGANVPAGYDSRSISNCIEVPSNAQTRSGRFFDTSTSSQLYIQGFIDSNGNIGADGKTIYLSFLQQPDRTSGFYELEFHKANLSDPGRIGGIGNDTGTGNVNLRAGGVNNYSLGAGDTGVDFYVVRIDYQAGNDNVYVYRNPTSNTEPAVPTLTVLNAADMSLNGVSVAAYNGPDVKVDEIRLGATWADAIGLAVSTLLPPTKTVNGYTVQYACTPGYSYRIQRSVNVNGPWSDINTNTAPADGFVIYQDTNAPSGKAFYRTVTP